LKLILVAAKPDEFLTWKKSCPCCGGPFVAGDQAFQSADHETYLHVNCVETLYRMLHPTDVDAEYEKRRAELLNEYMTGPQWTE
jgi:hypothetical protein